MRGDLAVLTLLLIVSLVCTGCARNTDPCAKLEIQGEKDSCYLKYAQETPNLKLCERLSSAEGVESCISTLVTNHESIDCGALRKDNNKGYCYTRVDLKKQQQQDCGNILDSEIKDQCYFDAASAGNMESCGKIGDEQIKAACLRLDN